MKLCDVLAADPEDSKRPDGIVGIALDKIDVASATAGCQAALSLAADVPRMAYNLGRALLAAGNFIDANTQFRAASDAGYAAADRVIGDMYANGQGFAVDAAKAEEFYRKAADGGDTSALLRRVETLQSSGDAADRAEASKILRAAADAGNPRAQYQVAIALIDRDESGMSYASDSDLTAAAKYLEGAVAADLPGARQELIKIQLYEHPFDHKAALKNLTDFANSGDPWAMTELGEYIITTDAAEYADLSATELFDLQNGWLEKAAALDYPQALYELGTNYASGLGSLKKDAAQARKLFQRAADLGHPRAAARLGFIVYQEAKTPEEYSEAAKFFQQALDGKEWDGALGLGHLYSTGMGLPLDYAKAVENYTIALEDGYSGIAGYELARIYDAQPGYKDPAKAADYLIEAIDQVNGPEDEAAAGFKEFSKATRVALQKELISRGLLSGSADGSFGPASLAAYLKTADWRS